MKEINIAQTIIDKRKEKGITQEDLAEYIGVSKASVSKWETGQSYPDITLYRSWQLFLISASMS